MSKPTLFFSHSSKDKDMILTIKNKLASYTGGVLDIFMSSDGQSIPFGTNWIHKIEEGLDKARIMFVFVTENSISSGWIYFEAGFAYSKGIQVIPVGIGMDIGALKAPLSLLQGFNITSGDGLNNFISVINKTFDYHFEEKFSAEDYQEILQKTSVERNSGVKFSDVVRSIEFQINATEQNDNDIIVERDVKAYFEIIKSHLEKNGIEFSYGKSSNPLPSECIMCRGIKITYTEWHERNRNRNENEIDRSSISFSISPFMFKENFSIYQDICLLLNNLNNFYVRLRLVDDYVYHAEVEDCSALLLADNWFAPSKIRIGNYYCEKLNLSFNFYHLDGYCVGIGYKPEQIDAECITKLIEKLLELRVIYKQGRNNHA